VAPTTARRTLFAPLGLAAALALVACPSGDDDDDDAGDDAVDDDDATTVIASGSYLIEYDWGRAWNQAGAGDGFPYQWRESIDMNWFEI
jgi:hypothetical protein